VAASDGGDAQRGGLCDSGHRQPQVQRPVDPQVRTQRADAGKACKTLGRTAFACAAEARQARTRVGAGGHTTLLPHRPIGLTPPYGQRGRPGPGAQPAQIVSALGGALASRRTARRTRLAPQRCGSLATNALAEEP
jgi:hypothetical protein